MSNGAKWWKFDFHTHTPVSHDYGKGMDQEELKQMNPKEWLFYHMAKEIDCVAVTDHNSGEWIDILKQTLQEMDQEKPEGYRGLHIFPGVEISVHGGIHLLAIFDKETTSEHIAKVLHLSGYNGVFGKTDHTTEKTFSQVVQIILKNNGLAIPAHVDKEAGIFKESSGLTLKQYLNCDGLLAMQVCDLNFVKPQVYSESKLKLTEIAGSDSHGPNQIGESFTWVKMESPNLDALKLALHDGEDGVIHSGKNSPNPNDVKLRYYIKSIEVKNSSKAGRERHPLQINFSPWFSTIIGGRGSGKSSILEFLRIVLNKEEELPKTLQPQFDEFKKVVTARGETGMLLNNTEIKVELVKDGRDIALIWNNHNISEFEKDEFGNWIDSGLTSGLSKRFPIRLYSQKQLYELTKDPDLLLQLIDNQFDRDKWDQDKLHFESEWLESRRKIRDLNNKLKRQKDIVLEVKDINAKIKLFEEMGHSEILNAFQNTKLVDSTLLSIRENLDSQIESVQETFVKLTKLELPEKVKHLIDKESETILFTSFTTWNNIMNEYRTLNQKITDFRETLSSELKVLPWNEQKVNKINSYTKLVAKLVEAGESDPLSYERLLQQKQDLLKEQEKFTIMNEQLETEKTVLNKIWENILNHEKQLRQHRMDTILVWNSNNVDLQIGLSELGNSQNAEESLRKALRKEGATFARDICERNDDDQLKNGIIHSLYEFEDDIWSSRNRVVKELANLVSLDEGVYTKKFKEHVKSIHTHNPEDIDRLLIWFPEDLVTLNLLINGREVNIDVGSAGQRTAAMLSLLLSIDDTPLIIDQPEDDLDTRRITDLIVKGLRKLKNKQQIIVVTHNPNIPVNGSAEMIIYLNFVKGQIRVKAAGALQEKEVRKAVCDVMEGGSEALSNRYYRIFKALE
jgi:energy-coupling factor transporter ATP-binding protein EcfA2